jgi:hypothetical protein
MFNDIIALIILYLAYQIVSAIAAGLGGPL